MTRNVTLRTKSRRRREKTITFKSLPDGYRGNPRGQTLAATLSVQNSFASSRDRQVQTASGKTSEQEAKPALTPALNYLGTHVRNIDAL